MLVSNCAPKYRCHQNTVIFMMLSRLVWHMATNVSEVPEDRCSALVWNVICLPNCMTSQKTNLDFCLFFCVCAFLNSLTFRFLCRLSQPPLQHSLFFWEITRLGRWEVLGNWHRKLLAVKVGEGWAWTYWPTFSLSVESSVYESVARGPLVDSKRSVCLRKLVGPHILHFQWVFFSSNSLLIQLFHISQNVSC